MPALLQSCVAVAGDGALNGAPIAMLSAALPRDEHERLALLHALDLLDTPAEPVFDRVVRLASRLLDVPMAAFSLVDAEQRAVLVDLAAIIMREVQYRERLAAARTRLEHSDAVRDASQARFRAVFEIASVGIALTTPDGRWISVNRALCEILGYSEDELLGRGLAEVTHEADREQDALALGRVARGETDVVQRQKRYLRQDGSPIWVEVDVRRKRDADGRHEYDVAVVKDIHAQKLAEEALARLHADLELRVAARTRELGEREEELRSVIDNANDAYISLDCHGRVTAWNRQAEKTFGWSAPEALGKPLEALIIPAELSGAHRGGMQLYLRTGASRMIDRRVELPALRRDGSRLTVEVRIRRHEVRGEPAFSAFLHDVTLRKQRDAQREFESRHDLLTGLKNRRALMEALPLAQARAQRSQGRLGLLFIDLDGFKAVNDRLGHDGGDALLQAIAQRLRQAVRRTDSVFRLAGDEFTVLLEDMNGGLVDAHGVGRKLVEALSAPVALCGATVQVGASIGIAVQAPGRTCTPEELIKDADHWMYQAKKSGRGCVLPLPSAAQAD